MILGGDGNDTIHADTGNDLLFGGLGNDILYGGKGNGQGYNTFVLALNSGTDTIYSFQANQDIIGLFGGLTAAQITWVKSAQDTILSAQGQTLAILKEVQFVGKQTPIFSLIDSLPTALAIDPVLALTEPTPPPTVGGSDIFPGTGYQTPIPTMPTLGIQLSGMTYVDADNDGVVDAGESPLAGITITLTGTANNGTTVNRTTTTATDGTYQFTDLQAGIYTLTETQIAGYDDGIDTVGTLGGNTSVNDVFGNITVAGGSGTGYNFGNRAMPLPAPVINPITTQSAATDGSTLTGTPGTNFLVGKDGNDTLIGLGGRDRLTGGAGADFFRYESFTDSLFTNVPSNNRLDHITDFNQAAGDRIQINAFTPANLFNAGAIAAANLQAALLSVHSDRDPSTAGSQALAVNEAVFFTFGQRTYLTVNDGAVGFANSSDLVIDQTNIKYKAGDNIVGSLTVSDYFS